MLLRGAPVVPEPAHSRCVRLAGLQLQLDSILLPETGIGARVHRPLFGEEHEQHLLGGVTIIIVS